MIAVISWRQISTEEPKPWQTQKIETDGTYVIGRARGSFICLEDIRVSRQHVTVERVGDRFHITDHGSANGAFLDGQPFETALWSPGQRLQISDFEFQISFQSVKATSGRATARRGRGGDGAPIGGGVDDEAYAAAQALIAEARRGGGAPMGGAAAAKPSPSVPKAAAKAAPVAPKASAVRPQPQPSAQVRVAPSGALEPLAWISQFLLLAAIVLTSMMLTVKVILLSVASKTSVVEDKAKEVLSIFGLELSKILDKDSDAGESFANAVDPWSFAWDMEAYRGLVIATLVVYGLCALTFIAWHAAVDGAVPFKRGGGLFARMINSALVWLMPVINLIQPPRAIGRVYEVVSAIDPVRSQRSGRVLVVWLWWILLLVGGGLMIAGQMEAPETLDAFGILTLVVAPLLIIASAACAVVLVRDLSDRIMRAAER